MARKSAEAREQELIQRFLFLEKLKATVDLRENLEKSRFLPSQQKLLDAYNDPAISTVIFCGANQVGKTEVSGRCLLATLKGVQPWDNRPRRFKPPVHVAILLEDYPNHACIYLQKLHEIVPPEDLVVEERTQLGHPRVLKYKPTGSTAHIFTKDQESRRQESATWHELYVDEPCDRHQWIALSRGLQKYSGKTIMTMTPLSEPWIYDDIYSAAANYGGEKENIFAITADPEENRKSRGGYLEDSGVDAFREKLTEEEREARVFGRFMHLQGRIFQDFKDEHILKEDLVDPMDCPWGVVIDPHDRKPFFILWFYVAPGDDLIFREEWPPFDFFETRQWGWGIDDYVLELKRHPKTFYRIMDPNYGRRTNMQTGLSISEQFQIRSSSDWPLAFNTSVDDSIEAGHKAVIDLLRWDRSRPMGAMNQPKLYVHASCRNTIKGFRNYTWDNYRGAVGYGKGPKEKPKEEYKDPMDCVRYAVMAQPKHLARTGAFDYRSSIETRPGWAQHRWRDQLEERELRPMTGYRYR